MAYDEGITSVMVETNSFDAIKLLNDKSGERVCFKELVADIWKMQGKF